MQAEEGAEGSASPIDEVFAERVRQIRRDRGMFVRELADRCVQLGAENLTSQAIGSIERSPTKARKRRRVDLADWFVISKALNVHPSVLITPSDGSPLAISSGYVVPRVSDLLSADSDAAKAAIRAMELRAEAERIEREAGLA